MVKRWQRLREFAPALVVLPPGHLFADQERVSLGDLLGERLILLPSTSLMRRWVDGKFAEIGRTPSVPIETTTMLSACRMVAAGIGITIADAFTVRTLPPGSVTTRVLEPRLNVTFGFTFPGERTPSALVTRFTEVVTRTATELLAGAGTA